jgi:putative addiction module component (TIGR02574 family)
MAMKTSQEIFEAAMVLPENERASLIERLMETLSPSDGELADDELAAELERRLADFRSGAADAVPWTEIKDQI